MSRIPIADVTAIGFTGPVFATIGAALFLGEKVRVRRILAVLIGLLGAIIILRPGFAEIELGALLMLVAAPVFAASDLLSKVLTRKESPPALVAYLSVFVTLVIMATGIIRLAMAHSRRMGVDVFNGWVSHNRPPLYD